MSARDDRQQWEERYAQRADAIAPPSDFVVRVLESLYPASLGSADPDDTARRALDVACGDGRHALPLARAGLTVEAIDRSATALHRAQRAARDEGLELRLVRADLEHFALPHDRYALVVNVRYLQRTLVRALKRSVRPGGLLAFETFIVDQAQLGHPTNPAFLLARGELRGWFHDFDLLAYDEGRFECETGPAFLARVCARRPSAWTPR
jgi:2-polyprenyl-3-methyl-5-hydroxy-6-metoxy-1,4-benzoquinol methylase